MRSDDDARAARGNSHVNPNDAIGKLRTLGHRSLNASRRARVRFGEPPKPTREPRVLPRSPRPAHSSCATKKRNQGDRDALQELEFVPPRVEVRDFVACRFQLRLQLENLRARFRIKIRRGKRGFQIRYLVFRSENSRLHRFPFALFLPLKLPRFVFAFRLLGGGFGRRGV